ncbi:hypothetical protein A2Y85_07895, partial [candidate division WOR-3 bacterium RBG_13_43_14]
IENQPKPYYLSYRVTDTKGIEIKAEFGGLLHKDPYHQRKLYVDLRVGKYDLDNSNFACQVSSSNTIDADQTNLPLENDYDAIRNAVWLVTDGTYKKALERLSRKKATLQNQPQKDRPADFSTVDPCTSIEPIVLFDLDIDYWQNAVLELSMIFKQFSKIQESSVRFIARVNNQYFLDNECNRNCHARTLAGIEVIAKTQASDGDPLENIITFYASQAKNLPTLNTMKHSVAAMADTLSLLTQVNKEEEYSGPVIFTSQAAAELIFQILGKGVSDPKAPLFENEMLARSGSNKGMAHLVNRYGRKVMPDFFHVWDDPNLKTWKGKSLIGGFSIDDQGVRAQEADIVTDGKMIGLMMSRTPIKKIKTSNGHARFRDESYSRRCIGMIGNLIVDANETCDFETLKENGLKLCRDYGLPYALIISHLTPTRELMLKERYMRYFSRGSSAEVKLLSPPAIAYKIDTLGKVSLIRGLEFSSVTTRVLRDIIAAGDQEYVYNFIYYDDEGNNYPVSVITPALLIEEMDFVPSDTKSSRLPIFAHPYFKK